MTLPSSAPLSDTAVLGSMTAFARASGTEGAWSFSWELRSVNGKGLDLRLRLPPGFEEMETEVRRRMGQAVARGSLTATLTAVRESEGMVAQVNEPALAALLAALRATAERLGTAVPTIDTLLTIKGIVEVHEAQDDEAARARLVAAFLEALDRALIDLKAMRAREGAALSGVLNARLDAIAGLIEAAELLPERGIEAVKVRLAEQVRMLINASLPLDPARLHQEAVLAATKADVREELDRLTAHVAAARDLLIQGGPVGRKLDFLAQEFHREANTLCSKSNAVALTQIGLELKVLVDQFREQIQNLE